MAVVAAIAKGMNVAADRLLFGPDRPGIVALPSSGFDETTVPNVANYQFIPELVRPGRKATDGEAKVSVGEGSVIALHKTWISQKLGCAPENLVHMFAAEADMEPLIRVGEIMLVDLGNNVLMLDGIYVLQVAERLTVKKLQFVGAVAAEVRAESEDYRPWIIKNPRADDVGVVGRVVWWGRSM